MNQFNKENLQKIAEEMRESSLSIWQAGLGCFMKAQKEGMKSFESLRADGELVEKAMKEKMTKVYKETREVGEKLIGESHEKFKENFSKLETVFNERVRRAVEGMGVVSKNKFNEVESKVSELEKEVSKLQTKPKTTKNVKAVKHGTKQH